MTIRVVSKGVGRRRPFFRRRKTCPFSGPNAQKIDGHQLNHTLLLSDRCEIDTKPELEIHADDVKCSHGATSGQMDEAALFYLRSRGIPEALARNLLVQSFIGEALEEISDETVRRAISDQVVHWLPAACYLAEEWRAE